MTTDNRKRSGLAPLPTGLLRPTTQPDPEPAADDAAEVQDGATDPAADPEPSGRAGEGAPAEARPARTRRAKRQAPSGESRGRKIVLTDDVHDRLWMTARRKRTTVSAVALEILDRELPRWKVEREG